MLLGGSLNSHKTFKKILSIGYEFETHDIAKLSLHENKNTLINSNLALRIIPDKIEKNSIKIVDDNYLFVRIPIERDDDKSPTAKSAKGSKTPSDEDLEKQFMEEFGKHSEKQDEKEDEDDDELQKEFMQEFDEDEDEDEEMDEFDEEFMEYFAEDNEKEELEKRENDSYLEYLNENRKKDNKKTTKFQVTNDIADGDFEQMLDKDCKSLDIPKNGLYYFKTNAGKMHDLKFSEPLSRTCKMFSGVEYVVTYYKPKQRNANTIIETFVDACSRIIDHLGNLEKTTGTLLFKTGKDEYKTAGRLEGNRKLYHKPGTNLYYMDTYDNEDWKAKRQAKAIADVVFAPQMTFRCKASDMIEIITEILNADTAYTISKRNIKGIKQEYDDVIKIEKVVDELIREFNKTAKRKISIHTHVGKTLKAYVYLIVYKLYYYIQGHVGILFQGSYLKDYIGFSSRHGNYDLYVEVKKIFKDHYGIRDVKDVYQFFNQPAILKPFFEFEKDEEEDYNEDGEFIYGEPLKTVLKKGDEHYGDPMYSFISYFHYFEDPAKKNENDWLVESNIDAFTTTFDLKNHEILLESRYFKAEIGVWLRNKVDPKIPNLFLTVKDMYTFVNAFYSKKNVNKLMNLEMDVNTHKLTKKCKPGFKRNTDFKCVQTKKKTNKRRVTKKIKST